MERNYCAFISYRHKPLDMAVAEKLHRVIEGYRIPRSAAGDRKRMGLVFRDKEELPVSGDLNQDICNALDHSENLIVVCSPDTVESRWVKNEIDYFLQRHDRTHVFAVLAKGEPEEVFPERLTHPDPEHPEKTVEPLAADVRGQDIPAAVRNVRRESLRLIAGMLGVPYDHLARREQKRKIRRTLLACGAVTAVLLGYAGFLLHSNSVISAKNRELEEKNETISRQKSALVQNESRLLTDAARTELDLDTGDMRTVLQNVYTAMTEKAGEEKVYYPPAEAVLMEALSVFSHDSGTMYTYTDSIRLEAPIYSYTVTEDGRTCFTLDRYGTVYGFDVSAGKQIWQTSVWKTDLQYYEPGRLYNEIGLEYAAGVSGVLADGRGIAMLDAETGAVRWEYPDAQGYVFSRDGTRITAVTYEDFIRGIPRFVVLDAATGQELFSASAGEGIDSVRLLKVSGKGADELILGVLSREPDRAYLLIDPDRGTVSDLYDWPEEMEWRDDAFAYWSGEAQTLLIVRPGTDATSRLLCISARDHRLLWEKQTPEMLTEDGPYDWFEDGDRAHVLFDSEDGRVYIGNGKTLCVCDVQTGETLLQYADFGEVKLLPSSVAELYRIRSGQIGAMLRDGTVMILIEYEGHLECIASALLGPAGGANVINGGFLELDEETWTLERSDGFVVQESEENRRELLISRMFEIPGITPGQETDPQLKSFQEPAGFPGPYDISADGRFIVIRGGNYTQYLTLTLDTEDGSLAQHSFRTEKPEIVNAAFPRAELLPDGEHMMLEWGNDTNLILADTVHQTSEILWDARETETGSSFVRDGTEYWQGGNHTRIARQADGSVLAAAVGWDDVLHIWKDGKEWITEPLPEGMQFRTLTEEEYGPVWRYQVNTGGNGLVVLSDYTGTEDGRMTRLAVFEPGSRQWRFLTDRGRGSADRIFVFSRQSSRFAVIDDYAVRVYDPEKEEPVLEMQLPLPSQGVRRAGISAGDEYYFVVSEDEQLMIYDAQSGEMKYREVRGTDDSSRIDDPALYADTVNHRLYAVYSSGAQARGCCIDTRLWQKLAEIGGLYAFCPETGKILQRLDDEMVLRKIPATEEMLQLTRDVLDGLEPEAGNQAE